MKTSAIILCGGRGTRMGANLSKLLLRLDDFPILVHTLNAFLSYSVRKAIDRIIIVTPPEQLHLFTSVLQSFQVGQDEIRLVAGGDSRQQSSFQGLQSIDMDSDLVVIHDGARPFVSDHEIIQSIAVARKYGAAVVAVPETDTIKAVNDDEVVEATLNRHRLWKAQTPQVFRRELIFDAHLQAIRDGYFATDDAALVERQGHPVRIVRGTYSNIKITTPQDMALARFLVQNLRKAEGGEVSAGMRTGGSFCSHRIGIGHDSHRLTKKEDSKPLILGGVQLAATRSLLGNSDSDVVLHAVFNALSQAIGGRSIGYYVDDLAMGEGTRDSREYLKIALNNVKTSGYWIGNIGITIECSYPRLEPVIPLMAKGVADSLQILPSQVGITVTSGEDLTAFGLGEGIQAWAVALLYRGEQHIQDPT